MNVMYLFFNIYIQDGSVRKNGNEKLERHNGSLLKKNCVKYKFNFCINMTNIHTIVWLLLFIIWSKLSLENEVKDY